MFRSSRPIAAFALLILLWARTTPGEARTSTIEQQQVEEVVRHFFAAAQADSLTALKQTVSHHFYVFDNGVRFDAEAIMAALQQKHAEGVAFRWNVTDADVHIVQDLAWITYVNRGSVTRASVTTNQQWLESAVLEKDTGVWRIVFMHSTHVTAPSPK